MFFWVFTALMIALALFFLLPPLLSKPQDIEDDRRDQNIDIARQQLAELENDYKQGGLEEETYLAAKSELEESLYNDLKDAEDTAKKASQQKPSKLPLIAVALFIPVLAIAMYLQLGNQAAISESSVVINPQNPDKPAMSMAKAVEILEGKLKEQPDNMEGWVMLGRSYMVLNRPADAVSAFEKAVAIDDTEPSVLLQLADALGTSNGGKLTGRPAQLIDQALQKDPANLMGLWLAGMAAKQGGDNSKAIDYWNKVLARLDPKSEEHAEVQELIAQAGGKVTASKEPSTPAKDTTGAAISVQVDLAEALKSKAQPGQTVFIYAKAVSGPPMPLAAVRLTVADLPADIVLDDSQAMMPQMKISGFEQVTVGARISTSGTPTKSSGDLFTEVSPVKLGQNITLNIDQVVP